MAGEEDSRREPRYVSRYSFKMMLPYCLVIFVGLGLVAMLITSRVVRTQLTLNIAMGADVSAGLDAFDEGRAIARAAIEDAG